MLKEEKGIIYANPGSATHPRGTDLRCYLLVDESKVSLKTLDKLIIVNLDINFQ